MCNAASRTGLLLVLILVGSECARHKRQDLIPSPRVGKRVMLRGDDRGDMDVILKDITDTVDTRPELLREGGDGEWAPVLAGPGREMHQNSVYEWPHQHIPALRRPHSRRAPQQTPLSPAYLQELPSLYDYLRRAEALTSDPGDGDSRSKLAL
ncbi:uncharacterized protein LOC127003164 isoform X2 [Eriocheir sinensis]|uniref:uncharacterized protein LOC127003164 isoform X2 n=1 Tax=Eriocheir sinensis TaxID=95602 RepID=UPI0021C7FC0A|nr:uncharacterized protein LOC127003164 isoform X2 [Eriocheir sinensis]